MADDRQAPYRVGDRIPDVWLPDAAGGLGTAVAGTPVRGAPRESVALVFPHAGCAECRAYVDGLLRSLDSFRRWDARLIVVLPSEDGGSDELRLASGASIVRDADDELWPHVGKGSVAVIVADPWGAVYEVVRDADGHHLPIAHEIVEWLRFIATQCPECGVPDTPGLRTWS